ncbi:MAG: riboflavin synthase [Desulfuromonadales bacterium]
MFTGLIETLGNIREVRKSPGGARLSVMTDLPMEDLVKGESIAVNGICLTVTSFGGGVFSADVSAETLSRTTLGELAPGSIVNLERALRLSDRLGGHLVTGHVDGVATVTGRARDGDSVRFTFGIPPGLNRFLVEKGSVAVDGISLTVNAVTGDSFSVSVIPHSLSMTTLQYREVGSRVNIETDLIGKYVERLLAGREDRPTKSSISLEFLAKHGIL